MATPDTLPDFDAATFTDSTSITNPLFPLPGGLINSYSAETLDTETGEIGEERNDHFATFETYTIEGVETVVVRDTAYEDGILVEDTLDWYAQDDAGNVWYLGEISTNYNYDDDDSFVGTDFGGSWEAGIDGALPGWIMLASPQVGDAYYQEYYQGVAEDEGEVVATGLTVDTGLGTFTDVVQIRDTSVLDGSAFSYKYFAPGVGQVLELEVDLEDPDAPEELLIEIENQRIVTQAGPVDPTELAFAGDGTEIRVTFLGEDSESSGAIGAYLFDPVTGEIGEGQILFADTATARAGDSRSVTVPTGMSLGLFMVPDVESAGLDLEEFLDGGLHFGNPLTGNLAAAYDDDPATEYAPGAATIFDGIAPVVMDANGSLLPIRPLHAVGDRDDGNFLNPVAGVNVREDEAGDAVEGVTMLAFEEAIASTSDYEQDDFDDALVAISDTALSASDLQTLQDEIGISRVVGTDDVDRLRGSGGEDQIMGLDGNDLVAGLKGADSLHAGDGNDIVRGGKGGDYVDGEDGDDRLFGGKGRDELDGGEGDDLLFGGKGRDELNGDEGDDFLQGRKGADVLFGEEGDDKLRGGKGEDRLLGGEDDDVMIGGRGADAFVFDLTDPGDDRILDFEIGSDVIEIATYLEVETFDDLEISADGADAVIELADGSVTLVGIGAGSLSEQDFVFV